MPYTLLLILLLLFIINTSLKRKVQKGHYPSTWVIYIGRAREKEENERRYR